MTPRRPDPFKPEEGDTYSRSQVKRAGRTIRKHPDDEAPGEEALEALARAFRILEWWRVCHAQPLSNVAAGLRYHVLQEANPEGEHDVAQRLKKRSTIISKLLREPTMSLASMHDIGGARAVVGSVAEVRAISRRLKKNWQIAWTRDYIDEPKDSGYRAVHHSVRREGFFIEVQLRTRLQDAWANQVEDDSREMGEGFKFDMGREEVRAYYRTMGAAFASIDAGLLIPAELIIELRERYSVAAPLLPGRPRPPLGLP